MRKPKRALRQPARGQGAALRRVRSAPDGRAVLLATGLLLAGGAAAMPTAGDAPVTPEALKSLSLEELLQVEVTSVSRHPEPLSQVASAIEVITAEDIRRSGATTLPEVLRLAGNLDVARKNSHDWGITARGFNTALANKLLVMIDGRTVYTPLFSGVFWDAQNTLLKDIERIEVVSGPGGTLWGANAVNGVINIITRSARETIGGHAEAAAGGNLRGSGAARYGGELAPGAWLRVYGQAFDRDDEVLASGADAGDGWRHRQAGFRLDAEPSPRDRLTLSGDAYDNDEHVVGGGRARASGGNLSGRWEHVTREESHAVLQVYYDHTRLSDDVPAFVAGGTELAAAGVLVDDLDTLDADFQYRFRAGPHALVWGVGYRHTRDVVDNAPALAFLPAVLEHDLFSAFVQDEVALRSDLLLTLGSKVEHNDYTGYELEPNVRLQWSAAPGHSVWTALSRAVRTPSRIDRDLYQPAPSAPLVVLQGSPDFVSESVVALEAGYRAQLGSRVAVSAAAFRNDYRDVRSAHFTGAGLLPIVFANDLEGVTWGLELGLDWHATDWWRLRGSWDPLRGGMHVHPGRADINDALNETADPSSRWALRSSMDLPHAVEFDLHLRLVSERAINAGPTIGRVPGYRELDLRLGWRPTPRLELSLAGRNLLHPDHPEYGFPDPAQVQIERSVHGKIAWQF